MMFDRLLYGMEWKCFSHDNTVLFHHNINRLSSLFTLRRSILTAMMPGSLLYPFGLFPPRDWFYNVRQILGFMMFERLLYGMEWKCFSHDNTVLFHHNIHRPSSLFTLRRSILTAGDASVSTFYPFGFFSPRDWFYNVDIS
jgi:hypothetical protein